jgi:hypothetical protein
MDRSVDEAFPHLTEWVTTHGWIEIGYDDDHRSDQSSLGERRDGLGRAHGVCHPR